MVQGYSTYPAQAVERPVAARRAAGAQLLVAVHIGVSVEAVLAAPALSLHGA